MINRKGRQIKAQEIADAAEAAFALALAAVAIRLLPFRVVVRLMDYEPNRSPRNAPETVVAAVGAAVRRASRRVPWRTVCFHEGLAAHWMLRRRGFKSKVHYGLKQGVVRLSAHVWVSLEGRTVVGEESADTHLCVAIFPAD